VYQKQIAPHISQRSIIDITEENNDRDSDKNL